MNHKHLWIGAAVIALVLVIGFMLSVPHTHDVASTSLSQTATITPPVSIHDVFKKGTHTITGSVNAPNSCSSATAQASLNGGTIVVAVSIPEDTGVCLQLPTKINFSTTVAAPANTPITATVNGSVASTSAI